jgi:drug/metabolite transporter (DMT)-like permease
VVAWYGLSIGYNNYNQFMKQGFEFPWAIAAIQLPVGLVFVIPMFILAYRKWPKLELGDVATLLPIIALNAIGHTATVIAMFQKGGGSFTHVIKASEPVVAVLLNLVLKGAVPKPLTALSLFPIVFGVAYAATLGDLDPVKMKRDLTTTAAQ